MKIHRSVMDDLQELYWIAIKEHGPQGRSVRIIREAMAQARAEQRSQGNGPTGTTDRPSAGPAERQGARPRRHERD